MAIFVEGVRGSGKSKIAVREIQTFLKSGRRVATNLDIRQELLAPGATTYITRLPDQPRSFDFELLGKAYPELDPDNPDTYDENKFGLVVVDELLTSFNSRSWSDKDRLACVSWMVQSRKLGWRLWLLAQDVDAVDKQLRETLLQEIWHCRSGKNFFSSPILGALFRVFTKPLMKVIAPHGFHILTIYTGKRKDKVHIAGREFYKLYNLHPMYKTSQQFLPDNMLNTRTGQLVDMRASYTALPADYFERRVTRLDNKPVTVPGTKTVTKPPLKLDWKIPAFIACLFSWLYMSSIEETVPADSNGQSTGQTASAEPDAEQATESSMTPFEKNMATVVITCSVNYGTAHADFCFESDRGTFYPENLGYQVSYLSPCQALVAFNGESKLVRCRSHYVASESFPVAALPTTETQG